MGASTDSVPPKRQHGATGDGQARGQSNVIAVVLLLGLVLTSASLIVMAGSSVLDQYRELAGQESTTNAIEEIDTELSSVASVGGMTRTEFSLGDAQPSQYRIARSGHINVTSNKNASCQAHIPLSSLRYERSDGVTIAFEAGGVWRQENGVLAQTVVHTPPDVTFENGTLTVSVMNFTGEVEQSRNLVYENVSRSIETNRELNEAMFQEGCIRPNNVTISVQSDFFRGWSGYLEQSIEGSEYRTFESNRTARVVLEQDDLPIVTNDSQNTVIDLTSSEFNDIDVSNNEIEVNKSANNTYTTIVTPLSTGSTQVGEIRVVEGDAAYRPPLDVVFVLDESGSMGSGSGSKLAKAKDASQAFVGQMNTSFDRAGAVSFDDEAHYLYHESGSPDYHVYLTDEFDEVNGSIDSIPGDSGTTYSEKGIRRAVATHGLKSNSSRKKVIILLADGEDTGGDPVAAAEDADKEGITIHTISFGNPSEDANETLQEVAGVTGGTWRAASASDDLSQIFIELFAEISESKQIVRDPFSMQLEAGSTTYHPQIDGETSHIATGQDDEFNLNDPTAPTNFSYSIDISDGENVTMTAVDYDCKEGAWERTGNIYENESTGQEYAEVRCTAIDESSRTEIPASNTDVYLDDEDVSSLLNQPGDWWHEDLKNETLEPYLDGPNNETLDIESNQAVIVFEFDDGDGGTDRLIALYRIGQSREEAIPKHIFNLEVRHLVIGEEN